MATEDACRQHTLTNLTKEVLVGEIRFGALCWNQYTAWPELLEAGARADRLGFDTHWT